eukprot:jgi/Psemu1/27209/gm1.27209_g
MEDNQLVALPLLGQPTQPTQIDEAATELTPTTSTISGGVSTNKKKAYNHKAEKDTHLISQHSHRVALELQQRGQDKADEERKLADQERKVFLQALIAQLATCGGASTADRKVLKRKLNNLCLFCADTDDSSDDDGDFE